jgi:hypothetical protein
VLAYTSLCLFLPAVAFAVLLREKKITMVLIARAAASFGLLILPFAAWYLFVFVINGRVYNHEMVCCGYGIWNGSKNILDYAGKFLSSVLGVFLNLGTKNLFIFATGLAAAMWLLFADRNNRNLVLFAAAVPAIFTVFFSVLTFSPDRVLFAVASPWLLPAAAFIESRKRFAALWAGLYLTGWIAWMCLLGLGAREDT